MRPTVTPQEQFARLLEVHSPTADVSEDPRLAGMTELANALRVAGSAAWLPAPDPDFRAALRQRLVAVAAVQDTADVPARRERSFVAGRRLQRRLAALSGVAMVASSFAGVGVAAARSLPGDPFYGVKRATEDVQLWTTFGTEAKGKRHLEFARTRLAEARALPPDSSHLAATLSAMDSQTRAGSSDLIASYRSSHSTEPLTAIVRFSRQQVAGLTRLATTLPTGLRAKEATSIGVVTSVIGQVRRVSGGTCLTCGPVPVRPGSHPPSPKPAGSPQPSHHPSVRPSPHRGGGASPRPGGHHSSAPAKGGASKPAPSPTSLIPNPLKSILEPKPGKHSTAPLPIVSTLLGGLGLK